MSSCTGYPGGQKGGFVAFVMVVLLLVSFVPAALAEVAVHRVPDPDGFMAPTLEGPWRKSISLSLWAPTSVTFKTDNGESKETINKNLGWLLDVIDYEVPLEVEFRKGSFGVYAHLLAFKISDTIEQGHLKLNYDDEGYLLDAGISYELGHWALGSGENPSVLTLEPFAGIRHLHDPVDVTIRFEPIGVGREKTIDLSYTSPVIGLRAFVDLNEQWNLRFDGDYGGFGVDDNHENWNLRGLVGYRFPGWGIGWNIQAGYRSMRVMGLQESAADVRIDIHGPVALISAEF